MKISKRQLRKTIRRLILENVEHFDKLIVLLTSPNVENIRQGILLGEEMEYLTVKRHVEHDRSGWSDDYKRYWLKKDPTVLETQYEWRLKLIPAFQERFMEMYPKGLEIGAIYSARMASNYTVLRIDIAPGYA
jgi:hypothetical protein